jgi:hypothetical protein
LFGTQGCGPEGRGGDVLHEATGDHRVAIHGGLARHFVDLFLANAVGVHIGLVGEVHQVVDHQTVVGLDVIQAAAVCPFGVVMPFHDRDQCRVCLVPLAGPDPYESVALFHREASNGRKAADTLARHGDGLAVATHLQPVVPAHQLAIADTAQGERRAAVGAKIFHGRDFPFLCPVKGDALVADGAPQRFVGQLLGRAGHIPGVFREHGIALSWAR